MRIHESQLTAELAADAGAILIYDDPHDGGVTVKADRGIGQFVSSDSEGKSSPNRLEIQVDRVNATSFDRVRNRLIELGINEAALSPWPGEA